VARRAARGQQKHHDPRPRSDSDRAGEEREGGGASRESRPGGGRHPGRRRVREDHGRREQDAEQGLREEHGLRREHGDGDRGGGDDPRGEPLGRVVAQEADAGRVPGDEPGAQRGEQQVEHLTEVCRRRHRKGAEQGREEQRVERRVVHYGRRARQVRVDKPEPVSQRNSDPGIETVVVEDPDQVVVESERAGHAREHRHRQPGAAGREAGQRRRHPPAGGNRL